jgi:cytochrome c peroxidase
MKKVAMLGVLVIVAAAVVIVTMQRPQTYRWQLANDLPRPSVPANNPMTDDKVELGRWLFYDTRLSVNRSMSCEACHIQALAFTDGQSRSVGATGDVHPRGSMSLINAAYATRFNWADPLTATLEDQMLTPLFGDNPVEMGLGGRESALLAMLRGDERYRDLFAQAYPAQDHPISTLNMVRAIGAFVRSIVSFRSPYDQYLAGDDGAISDLAKQGEQLFFDERFECFHCHGGFNFADSSTHESARVERVAFHNNGLYNIGNSGAYPEGNQGLAEHTGERRDIGRFKAPSLRNIAVTAPYMHDGSLETLEDVLAHYARGGRLIEEGAYAGDGNTSPYKSEFVRGFEATDEEFAALLAFLESLTDKEALIDRRWASPWTKRNRPASETLLPAMQATN